MAENSVYSSHMKKQLFVLVAILILLTGCGGGANSNSTKGDPAYWCKSNPDIPAFSYDCNDDEMSDSNSESNGIKNDSKGRLFGGKCAQNQQWLANLESAGSVPADWQSVYDLVNHSNLENYWGILSEGTTFSTNESVKWSSYTALLGASVVQGDYSKASKIYNLLLPLMEKMDLQCAVAVTGTTGLSSTVVP